MVYVRAEWISMLQSDHFRDRSLSNIRDGPMTAH